MFVEQIEGRRLLAAGDLDPGFGQGGIVRAELYPPFEPDARTVVHPHLQHGGAPRSVGTHDHNGLQASRHRATEPRCGVHSPLADRDEAFAQHRGVEVGLGDLPH